MAHGVSRGRSTLNRSFLSAVGATSPNPISANARGMPPLTGLNENHFAPRYPMVYTMGYMTSPCQGSMQRTQTHAAENPTAQYPFRGCLPDSAKSRFFACAQDDILGAFFNKLPDSEFSATGRGFNIKAQSITYRAI